MTARHAQRAMTVKHAQRAITVKSCNLAKHRATLRISAWTKEWLVKDVRVVIGLAAIGLLLLCLLSVWLLGVLNQGPTASGA